MKSDDIIFSPFDIGKMRIKNRVVRSATSERGANEDGTVTDNLIKMYEQLGAGGAGIVITGYSYVLKSGRCNLRQLGVHDDSVVDGLKKLTEAFHKASSGGKIVMQLVHGGRQVKPYAASEVLAPSAVPLGEVTPRPLEPDEIMTIVEAFGDAALRAKEAGFDGVQIHAAHGFLVSSFLSPYLNRRNDEWGGNPENRRKFFLEIIRKIRVKVGVDYPVLAKINGSDFVEDGLEIDEAVETAAQAEQEGLDAIEVSGGIADTPQELGAIRPGIDSRDKEAYFETYARRVRGEVNVPVITVGGIRSAQVARQILRHRSADAVSMSRPFIREPDLPKRWKRGQAKARCVSCQGCLINTGEMIECILE